MELNIQVDHVHLMVMMLPKASILTFVGPLKGRTAIRLFNQFRELKHKPYWGNRFWMRGYCVDTIGLNGANIRTHVRYQEKREQQAEQRGLEL